MLLVNSHERSQYLALAKYTLYFKQWDDDAVWCNVLGTMLHPDDHKQSHQWISATMLKEKLRWKKELYSPKEFGEDVATLAKYCSTENIINGFTSKQCNSPDNVLMQCFDRCFLIGYLLNLSIINKISIRKAFDLRANNGDEALCLTKKIKRDSFFNHVWPKYKPVAHLWASFVLFLIHRFTEPDNPNLSDPSSKQFRKTVDRFFDLPALRAEGKPDGFAGFLRLADDFLEKACKIFPDKGNQALLAIKDSWVIEHPYRKPEPHRIWLPK